MFRSADASRQTVYAFNFHDRLASSAHFVNLNILQLIGCLGNIGRTLRPFIRGRDDSMRRFVGGKRFFTFRSMDRSQFLESLESRVVLNASTTSRSSCRGIHRHDLRGSHKRPDGAGVRNDKVALYNSSGSTIAIASHQRTWYYQFGITQNRDVRRPSIHAQTIRANVANFHKLAPGTGYPFQSPINISAKAINLASVLKVSYTPNYSTGETIAERSGTAADGVEVGFVPSNSDYVTAGGTVYQLTQFHFHSPSEDRINGKSTNVEIHFVNQSADGGISVLAVFVKLGVYNYSLDPILKAMNPALKTTTSPPSRHRPDQFRWTSPDEHARLVLPGLAHDRRVRGTAQLVRIPENRSRWISTSSSRM